MSDPRTNTTIVREKSSGNGGILFVLGAIVVALGIVLYFVLGGDLRTDSDGSGTTNSVTIEAPPAAEPAAPAPAAPAPAAPAAPALAN